jgi:hypothetical protein
MITPTALKIVITGENLSTIAGTISSVIKLALIKGSAIFSSFYMSLLYKRYRKTPFYLFLMIQ